MASPLHDLRLTPARFISTRITPEGITAHHGGDTPWGSRPDRSTPAAFRDSTDHNRCATIVRAWHHFHIAPKPKGRGWAHLGYTSVVCPHGHRYEGRGPGRRTGANGTNAGNDRSYAVCYIAGTGDPLTLEAMAAFHDEAERLEQPLRWNHSDWKSTECAGAAIKAWQRAGFPNPNPEGDDVLSPELEAHINNVKDTLLARIHQVEVIEHRGRTMNLDVVLVDTLGRVENIEAKLDRILAAMGDRPEREG